MDNVNLKRKVTLKRKGDAPDQTPEGKKPNKLIWLGVLALVIMGGIFGLKQLNQQKPGEGGSEEVVVTEGGSPKPASDETEPGTSNNDETNPTADNTVSDQTEVSNTSTETISTSSVESDVTSKPSSTGVNSVAKEDAPNTAPSNKGSQSSTVAVSGSVEDKAKQVIRGDFGNGKERKLALGAEYDAIQAKVNEMYRSGLIE
jgi:cytoskeletal protein RodZ